MRSMLLVVLVVLASCGAQAPSSPHEYAGPVDTRIVGTWHGEMSGGGMGAVADYTFRADGTYSMQGYPSIAERGRFTVERTESSTLTLHLTERRSCGPCENAGPVEAREDSTETAEISADHSTLRFRNWTFARTEGN